MAFFIKLSDGIIVNIDRVIGIVRDGDFTITLRVTEDGKYRVADENAKLVWDYFNSIAMTPGEGKQEQPEQMSRREAETIEKYGECLGKCPAYLMTKYEYKCNCGFIDLRNEARSILGQSE